MYDALGSNCRNLVTIRAAVICQMAESISIATSVRPVALHRFPPVQHDCINRFRLLPWLDAQLKADCAWSVFRFVVLFNDTSVSVQADMCGPVTTAITPL